MNIMTNVERIIKNIEQASVPRLAIYTAISGTLWVICFVISSIFDTTPNKTITLGIIIMGIIWTGMFGGGTIMKYLNPLAKKEIV